MLSKCTQELYIVPFGYGIENWRTQLFNCAVSGQDRHAFKVQRLIVNETFEPIWVRSPDASCWIYSLKFTMIKGHLTELINAVIKIYYIA